MKLFARFEPDRFSGCDGDLGSGPWVATNAGFSWFDGKDAKAAKFNTIACNQRLLHALEDSVYSSLCFSTWQAGTLNNPLYEILLYHSGPPSLGCKFW